MNFPKTISSIFATLLFVLLFFEKSLGLNVAIYGVVVTLLLVVLKTALFQALLPKVVGIGFLATSLVYLPVHLPYLYISFLFYYW
jgi:hypothetical protein